MIKRSIKIFLGLIIFAVMALKPGETFPQSKYKVKKVEITGNKSYSDRLIKKLMLTRKYSWLARNYYEANLFNDDIEAITNFYIHEGYLEAKIEKHQAEIDTLAQQAIITISIDEGERTRISGISFFNNRMVSDSILNRLIKSAVNKPFKKKVLERDAYDLLVYYADRGYIEAKVEPTLKLNPESHEILIDFTIKENTQVIIGEFKIEGIKKTRPAIVLRELEFQPGQVYNYGKILKSQRQLYLTGLFNSVFIRPDERSTEIQSTRNISINVDEKKNGEANFGLGYGTLDRLRGSAELLQNNLFGTARQAGLSVFASSIARRGELSFTEPWLLATRAKADLNGFIEQRHEPGYDIKRHGFKFTLGKRIGNHSNWNLAYRYEIVRLSTVVDPNLLKPDEKGNTRSLTVTAIRDSRDDLINTTRGSFSSMDIESAGALLKGTSTFIKLTGRFKYFYPLTNRLVVATALTAGWMDRYGASDEIPIQERFFTGGAASVRGFKEKYVGPQNEFNNPIGGNLLLTVNLCEFRYTFYKKLSAIAFLDLGNVWANSESLKRFDIREAIGAGIRYNSPLGILRLDYGIKLDRQADEAFGEFYFSVGQAF